MPRTTILPINDYPTGALTIGPANIADGLMTLHVAITRCTAADPTIWPLSTTIVWLRAEVTTQPGGNADWVEVSGARILGGILPMRDGSDLPESLWEVKLPPGNNRRIRVQSVIENGPLRTSVTVVTE